VPLEPVTHHD